MRMRRETVPSAPELLATWEAGLAGSGADRAMLLHALARPAAEVRLLLDLPVGAREADLLTLRAMVFGEVAQVRLRCDGCDEEMEFGLDTRQVLARGARPRETGDADADVTGCAAGAAGEPAEVTFGEWAVRFRLPTPGDLIAAGQSGPARARDVLLGRCVLEARCGGLRVQVADLPGEVQEMVAAAAAEADPHADVWLDAPCPACGRHASVVLDAASFLWAELDAWARGTLLEVHLLATAYGWTEPDVLALSPGRRRHYLELTGHA
jgi:hypothetical protein